MGNCLNPASSRLGAETMLTKEEAESLSEMKRISQALREEEEEAHAEEEAQAQAQAEAAAADQVEGLKVKIVLTRAELEWLMAQLKSGDQRLQDVLHHMHAVKARATVDSKDGAWRPRLESIIECPETAAAAY